MYYLYTLGLIYHAIQTVSIRPFGRSMLGGSEGLKLGMLLVRLTCTYMHVPCTYPSTGDVRVEFYFNKVEFIIYTLYFHHVTVGWDSNIISNPSSACFPSFRTTREATHETHKLSSADTAAV